MEKFVLFPLLIIIVLASSAIAFFWEHSWPMGGFFIVAGAAVAMRFAKHLRNA